MLAFGLYIYIGLIQINFALSLSLLGRGVGGEGMGSQRMAQSVLLLVKIPPISADRMEIPVGVRPCLGQTYLPAQLQLAVLDEGGAAAMAASANSANKNILLQFSGEPGENFSVKVALGDVSVIYNLVF